MNKSRKRTITLVIIAVVLAGVAVVAIRQQQKGTSPIDAAGHSAEHRPAQANRVPAHYATEPPRNSLPPTLDPEAFTGRQREAYRVVREVPELIAQLPCYCYCDRGFGHKSLQSCYVDDHAAHCAVCVDEVLEAYNLQKQGLSAPRIRERIIAQFGG